MSTIVSNCPAWCEDHHADTGAHLGPAHRLGAATVHLLRDDFDPGTWVYVQGREPYLSGSIRLERAPEDLVAVVRDDLPSTTTMTPAEQRPTCPSWCRTEHVPDGTFHASRPVSIPTRDWSTLGHDPAEMTDTTSITVQASYDSEADPELLIELGVGHTILLDQQAARQLAKALTRLLAEVAR